jgi:hypothetical protein
VRYIHLLNGSGRCAVAPEAATAAAPVACWSGMWFVHCFFTHVRDTRNACRLHTLDVPRTAANTFWPNDLHISAHHMRLACACPAGALHICTCALMPCMLLRSTHRMATYRPGVLSACMRSRMRVLVRFAVCALECCCSITVTCCFPYVPNAGCAHVLHVCPPSRAKCTHSV